MAMTLQEKLDNVPVSDDLFSELSEKEISQCMTDAKHELKCMWLSKHAKTFKARKKNYNRVKHWDDKLD